MKYVDCMLRCICDAFAMRLRCTRAGVMRPLAQSFRFVSDSSSASFSMLPLIVADWDETITTKDTIALLAEAAYAAKPDYSPPFSHFVDIYMQALLLYDRRSHPRTTLAAERQYQEGLPPVEMASIEEIERLRLFEGVRREQFVRVGKKVQLKDGFLRFCSHCNAQGIPVVVLSINWSRYFIAQCLKQHGVENVVVVSNELEFQDDVCTGLFDKKVSIRTGIDKESQVQQLRNQWENRLLWYIGDSSTDLFALLESDVGVVIDGGKVGQVAAKLGIPVVPLDAKKSQKEQGLYSGSWDDIVNALPVSAAEQRQ